MEEIKRDIYLTHLINSKENDMIKVITGINGCGKSYLLDPIYKNYLLKSGVKEDHIIKIDLNLSINKDFLNSSYLDNFVRNSIKDDDVYYVLIDEIQKIENFESVLNGFLKLKNLDVYVTGSFLSTDIITELRSFEEVRVFPLSFKEVANAYEGNLDTAWDDYLNYGGLPYILSKKTKDEKSKYLKDLFNNTYYLEITKKNNIERVDVLDSLVNILASSVGTFMNPKKIADTFASDSFFDASINTIKSYINYLLNAFIIEKVERYDIKGKKHITTPFKYYFTDIGLRNAKLNFSHIDENVLMENIIYNELLMRGYNIDIGVVETFEHDNNGKTTRKKFNIDFICNLGSKKYYIQSALNIDEEYKKEQELKPLLKVNDFFKKIVIVKDNIKVRRNEVGIIFIGIKEFLLNEDSLDI